MWLFNKNRRKQKNKPTVSDKVAGKIVRMIIKIQTKFSEMMNKQFSKMSNRSIKIVLVVFCLCAGGYSIYLIGNGLLSKQEKQSFKIEQAEIPGHLYKAGDEMLKPEPYVDEEIFRQIQNFKHYLDSMKVHDRKIYDSIMLARPKLMDSVLMLEELYHYQKIK